MTFGRILIAVDVLIAAVILYFFPAGLADGSVSSWNADIWTAANSPLLCCRSVHHNDTGAANDR
jgi:hypothetical protein